LKATADKAGKAYNDAMTFLRGDWTRRARGGYSLGPKLLQQKMRLREDYRKVRAAEFTLKDFHDNLLKDGAPR
jgi:hypothetical protein